MKKTQKVFTKEELIEELNINGYQDMIESIFESELGQKVLDYMNNYENNWNLHCVFYGDLDFELDYIKEDSSYFNEITTIEDIIIYNIKEDFDLELAKKVADVDMHIGVLCAMEELEKIGFSTSVYNAFIEQIDIEDHDALNLEARDLQYKVLGIYELMQQAYELMEE